MTLPSRGVGMGRLILRTLLSVLGSTRSTCWRLSVQTETTGCHETTFVAVPAGAGSGAPRPPKPSAQEGDPGYKSIPARCEKRLQSGLHRSRLGGLMRSNMRRHLRNPPFCSIWRCVGCRAWWRSARRTRPATPTKRFADSRMKGRPCCMIPVGLTVAVFFVS